MELYASYRDSFRNCSTFVYVGTEKEVEDEWNKRDRRKKELEQKGFHGYARRELRGIRIWKGVFWIRVYDING